MNNLPVGLKTQGHEKQWRTKSLSQTTGTQGDSDDIQCSVTGGIMEQEKEISGKLVKFK